MRIAVYGLWHLGCVTAGCLAAAGHRVVGLDSDEAVVADLRHGKAPLHEPGLDELIGAGLAAKQLGFTTRPAEALGDVEVLWVTFDTPVDDSDQADLRWVEQQLDAIQGHIRPDTLVLISSQVPAGFTKGLEEAWQGKGFHFAYSPENLRLGKALDSFRKAERTIVGLRDAGDQPKLAELLGPFCQRIEWMSPESAEMTKHALNAFLATSVTFINEVARLCEAVGADAKEVERGLRSEGRIGPRAYLSPGAAFAGGTLARDVRFLVEFGNRFHVGTPLFRGVLSSNDLHKNWAHDKVRWLLDCTAAPVVAVLGLTYKPGTSTLRRSAAVELCGRLHEEGIRIQAHDPAVRALPNELRQWVVMCGSAEEALQGADVAVIATEWPAYRALRAPEIVQRMRRPRVVDPNHFLAEHLGADPRIIYFATGARSPLAA
jgi:UDPglucose 6-dehydrogenase